MSKKSLFSDNIDRKILPRWRDSSRVAGNSEALALRSRKCVLSFEAELGRVREELSKYPNLGVAAEAISLARFANDISLHETAMAVLKEADSLPTNLRRHMQKETQDGLKPNGNPWGGPEDSIFQVGRLRKLMQHYPRNPLLFMDLARHQSILGEHEKAEKSARIALSLAPNHRQILRSSVRFYVNNGEGGIAMRLLAKSPATKNDPWLIAAELATAQTEERAPKFMREARRMLEQRTFQPAMLTELAAAVGTYELLDGKRKDAKKHFETALLSPNENALAQIKWADERGKLALAGIEKGFKRVASANEAAFLRSYLNQDLLIAAPYAEKWYNEEPFSADAAIMATYVYCLLDDYAAIERITEFAVRAHPTNDCLHNNDHYARISSGMLFEGDPTHVEQNIRQLVDVLMHQIRSDTADVAHAAANLGLLLYRMGIPEEGRKAYDYAVQWATKRREKFSIANALTMHSREAILAKTEWAPATLAAAQVTVKQIPNFSAGLSFYISKLEALAADPDNASTILNPATANKYLKKKPMPVLGRDFQIRWEQDGRATLIVPHLKA